MIGGDHHCCLSGSAAVTSASLTVVAPLPEQCDLESLNGFMFLGG